MQPAVNASGEVDVVTVGHAIVDVLAFAEDDVVTGLGLTKGTMILVDDDTSGRIYARMGPSTEVSGGSAANTAVGLAALGTTTAFIGRVRDDVFGAVFNHDIHAAGVSYAVPAASSGPGTGRCLIMVTPDAEKTMCTTLGIAGLLAPDDIDAGLISRARIVYLEGYLCGLETTEVAVERVLAAAEQGGTLVALSLSDPSWVQVHGDALEGLLDRVDVLFANADEACGLVGTDDLQRAVRTLAARCPTVAVTRGAAGSVVASAGELISVPAAPVARVVDTTGAGDMYAAGFLSGLVRGLGSAESARLGGMVAAEVVTHLGARPVGPLAHPAAGGPAPSSPVSGRGRRIDR